jgi:hypothetical protein
LPFLLNIFIDNSIKNHDIVYSIPAAPLLCTRNSAGFLFYRGLNEILLEYPEVSIKAMGFPDDWEESPLWKD